MCIDRRLSIYSTTIACPFSSLESFSNLRHLSVDFSHDGLSTQSACLKFLFGQNMSTNRPLLLQSLTLHCLPRIDTKLLKMISNRFPYLQILHLSSTERLSIECCWNCLEESASSIVHSPIPDMFASPEDLAVSGLSLPDYIPQTRRSLLTKHAGYFSLA